MPKPYIETFDNGPGGWMGWISNSGGPKQLPLKDSAVMSSSPWWIDYNHAPPGAGYLHMVYMQMTRGPLGEAFMDAGGKNHFVQGNHSRRFTNAKVTVRTRGELELRGAQLVLLIQSTVDGLTSPHLLTGQPVNVTREWSETTMHCTPDPKQWTSLGVRHDRGDTYGHRPLEKVLDDVNIDIMLVLFPLNVVPMGPLPTMANGKPGDPHILRPEKDYPVWRSKLPEGYIWMDEFRVEYA